MWYFVCSFLSSACMFLLLDFFRKNIVSIFVNTNTNGGNQMDHIREETGMQKLVNHYLSTMKPSNISN